MEKLLALATLGHKAYNKWLFQRMISRVLAIVGMVLMIAILLSALLIGLLGIAYIALVQSGIAPQIAALTIGTMTVSIIGLLIMLARHFLRQLPRLLAPQAPITSRISDLLNAFIDGFMEK